MKHYSTGGFRGVGGDQTRLCRRSEQSKVAIFCCFLFSMSCALIFFFVCLAPPAPAQFGRTASQRSTHSYRKLMSTSPHVYRLYRLSVRSFDRFGHRSLFTEKKPGSVLPPSIAFFFFFACTSTTQTRCSCVHILFLFFVYIYIYMYTSALKLICSEMNASGPILAR